ncbi:hypothetical protein [Streptomyces sp. NPDC048191]|uniref:hypothetical protein n=1 Tax=Streptomyces sp. NPDC048191 TaxID=3155484 RepID=UPI0033EC4522
MRFDAGEKVNNGRGENGGQVQPWPVDGYTFQKELTNGATSSTVLARRGTSRRVVMIEYLCWDGLGDAVALERVQADNAALCLVRDPRLARIYSCHVGVHGIAAIREFISGSSLRQVLDMVGTLGPSVALFVVLQCLHGIAAVHENGIAHGNFRAESVMVLPDGRIKIVGCALRGDTAATAEAHHDIRAAAMLLIECLAGRRGPFEPPGWTGRTAAEQAGVVRSLLSLTRQAVATSTAGRQLQAAQFIRLLTEWAETTLEEGWQARAQSELAAAVRHAPAPVDGADWAGSTWPVLVGLSTSVVLSVTEYFATLQGSGIHDVWPVCAGLGSLAALIATAALATRHSTAPERSVTFLPIPPGPAGRAPTASPPSDAAQDVPDPPGHPAAPDGPGP